MSIDPNRVGDVVDKRLDVGGPGQVSLERLRLDAGRGECRHDLFSAVTALHVVNGDTRAALAERHRTRAAQAGAAASHQRHSVKVRHRHIEVSGLFHA